MGGDGEAGWEIFQMSGYVKRILLGLDQWGNTIIGGYADESISARAGRNKHKWYWKPLVWVLNKLDPGHTDRAVRNEVCEKHQDPYYRDEKDCQ